jgi:hypothetical protein
MIIVSVAAFELPKV